ncbi:MAG: oligosaccharide flippase family protein [Bacteroidales bacterium]|jgi:O-antigen/teichoic acid export membrane protein|nr:oligosaccharide flippase family protein [Bacteroidales bacterium]
MKRDVLIYFAGKIIPALVNLTIIILAVRFLGKAEYGKYSLVFYATMLLSTLTFGWIQQSILRFLSAYPEEQVLVVNRFYFLTLVSTLLAVILGFFLSIFYFHLRWSDTAVVIIYIFMYNVFLFHLTLNQTKRKSIRYAILEGSYYLIFLVFFLLLTLVFNKHLFIVLFIAMVLGLVFTEIIRIGVLPGGRVGLDHSHLYFHPDFSKKVFDFGFPITIWLFLSYFLSISDRFIIKEFTSYENVGTYSAIKDFIIKIATFTTIPILLAYHPMIVEKWNDNRKKEAIKLIREGLNYCFLIAVLVFIFFIFFQNLFYTNLLHLQVMRQFLVSGALIGSAFLWQAAMLLHKPLELLLKPRLMLFAIIAALTVNALANLIFVPVYGYPASAVISLVSVITYIIVIFAFLIRFRKQGLLK